MAEAQVPLVLVTGASGFIASHCIKLLLEGGEYRLRGTVRSLKNEERCEAIKNLAKDPKYPIELVEANLLEEEGWDKAVEGCTYILHIASPFIVDSTLHEDKLVKPAVEGTLNVLKAARDNGGIKRVVVTSSLASIYVGNMKEVLDESMWSNTDKIDAYSKSKTLAEKAAWDFIKDLPDDKKFELSVINPGFVVGPILLGPCESSKFIKQLLMREMSMVPDISSPFVDVRDVAKAHVIAMTLKESAGNRHILVSEAKPFLFVSTTLAKEFTSQGYRPPTKQAPKFLLWCLSWFNKDVKSIYPFIGLSLKVNNSRMKDVLKIEPLDVAESFIETAHTMIERGLVPKSPQYKGRKTHDGGQQETSSSQPCETQTKKEESKDTEEKKEAEDKTEEAEEKKEAEDKKDEADDKKEETEEKNTEKEESVEKGEELKKEEE